MTTPLAEGPLVLLVGSGKGGVGKSVLSIILGSIAARAGRRTLLFNADLNLGNLHVLLGVRPTARVDALLNGDVEAADLVRPLRENLWLLPGTSGGERLHGLESLDRARLETRLSVPFTDYDVVIVDAGAGIDGVVRTATISASRLVVVTVPEPAALTDAYALMKIVHLRTPDIPIDVLVNRCRDDAEGRAAFDKLATASERFLRRGIRHLGSVGEESTIGAAAREPSSCLSILDASLAAQSLTSCLLDRMELPAPVRSTQ